MRQLRTWMRAITLVGACLGAAVSVQVANVTEARACSCASPGNHVLLPSSTTLAPLAGPWLVLHGPDASVRLTDEQGVEWPVESARKYENLSLCVFTYDLIRPTTPLPEDRRYVLELSSPDEVPDSRDFVATPRGPRLVSRQLSLSLERVAQAGTVSGAGCGPSALNGEVMNGYFFARVTADQPSLLFLELSVDDSKHGKLVSSRPSIDEGPSSAHALVSTVSQSIPELVTSSPCARVVIRDAMDATIYDKELCPKVAEKLEETLTAEVSEHLIREEPEQEDDGCSCSSVGSRRELSPGFWLLVAAAALSLRRRALASAPIARTL